MSIGQRIRDLRVQNGMSQGDIERETGMLRGYISRVECGHTVPSVETLHRFASALDVPVYRFFAEEEPEPLAAIGGRPPSMPGELAQLGGSEGSEARFLLRMKTLAGYISESDRAFLLNFARRLASLRRQCGLQRVISFLPSGRENSEGSPEGSQQMPAGRLARKPERSAASVLPSRSVVP
jgi:transcriptional regulator with XRE-family HTH domain